MTYAGPSPDDRRRATRAGIGKVHAHQLRHNFAHSSLSQDGNEGDLIQLAGWRSSTSAIGLPFYRGDAYDPGRDPLHIFGSLWSQMTVALKAADYRFVYLRPLRATRAGYGVYRRRTLWHGVGASASA
jgi:hypothetical protein